MNRAAGPVPLSWSEVLYVGNAAVIRCVHAQRAERSLETLRTDLGFERHLIGLIGEYVFSKFLDVHFHPVLHRPDTTDRDRDVAGYQVRATIRPNGRLPIKATVDPADPWVLVQLTLAGPSPHAEVCGWILAGDAQAKYELRDVGHTPAHYVPAGDLEKEFGS